MIKYIAFLRAINVAGHATVKMTDLWRLRPVAVRKANQTISINLRRRSTSYLVQALANAPGIVQPGIGPTSLPASLKIVVLPKRANIFILDFDRRRYGCLS